PDEIRCRRRLRHRRLGVPERHPVQHLARQLLHRRAPPRRHQRNRARAVPARGPRIGKRLAPLLVGDSAAPQSVPRTGRVLVANPGVRRPRQRLDAHGRPYRFSHHRHSRVLPCHQSGPVRTGVGALADPCARHARDPPGFIPPVRPPAPGDGMNPRRWWVKLGHGSLMLLAMVYCLFPIYFMLVQSLKTPEEDVFGNPFLVMNPTLENFEELFERKGEVRGFVGAALRRSYPFLDWLANTLFVFAGSVVATLVASVAAGYALGRLRPPGFRWWRRVIFATYV